MSGGMPELGSKISLISKADIRYEGRLYTVDPQECTIALSSVRSFGTEDRETQFQIAPQSQIYDYILFRGSDIKDIRVVNNSLPHPNDPAIMQVQLPNGQHLMPHFPMPSMNPAHAPPMGGGPYGNPFGAMAGLGGMTGAATAAASALAPGAGAAGAAVAPAAFMLNNQQQQQQQQQQHQQQQQNKQQQQKQPMSVIDLLAGASRSTTPISLISRKSPSADMGVQVNQQQQQQQHHNQQHHHNNNNHHNNNQQHQNHHQNNTGGGGGGGGGHGGQSRDAGHKRQNHHQPQQQQHQQQQQQQRGGNNQRNNDYYHQRDRRDSSGRNVDNNNYNNHDNRGGNNYNNQRNNQQGGGGGQNRAWTMHRGQQNNGGGAGGGGGGGGAGGNNNNMMRSRGGAGRGRMPNQGYRPMGGGGPGGNQNKPRNAKNTIKFEQDFDFEQANNKFEELRSQLSKLKVGGAEEPKTTEQCTSSSPTPPSQINGGTEIDKKDDSGNETGAGEHEPEDEEITVGYDKTKSFFDNISCEAAQDRKNKKNDWRQERKLNSETFGVSSTRRGGYRGRGSYYSRNMGSYNGGGGYNRGYRGGNNYNRNRNNNGRMGNHLDRMTNERLASLKLMAPLMENNADVAAATTPNSKTTTTQENNTQPQVAAVGAGQ